MAPKPTLRTTLKDSKPVFDVLDGITVADEVVDTSVVEHIVVEAPAPVVEAPVDDNPYAAFAAVAAVANPYAAFADNPYATLNPYLRKDDNPYAAALPNNPYRKQRTANPYADNPYQRPAGGGRRIRRTIVLLPPPLRTEGELLWIPAVEYERAYESEELNLWLLGRIVDFDEALESMSWNVYGDDEDPEITMQTIDEEDDTWCNYDFDACEHEAWPDVMELAQTLRAEVAGDPAQITEVLDLHCLHMLADMVGMTKTPMHDVIHNAIVADPNNGLGAAAIDHAVWHHPGELGHTGVQMDWAMQEILHDGEGMRLWPVENFLIYRGSLHPGTLCRQQPHSREGIFTYTMYGQYVVSKVTYHSDLDGIIVGGWRSCWLEPIDETSI